MTLRSRLGSNRHVILATLFLMVTFNYLDRLLVSILLEPIKLEFGVSDTAMGLLTGFAFAAAYALFGIPVARLADRGDRRLIILISFLLWSVMTMACGFATSFIMLAIARGGVGIGEAGGIPPAHSLVGDYYPPAERGRALAVLMLGSTVGPLLAFLLGPWIAAAHGWRFAFLVFGAAGVGVVVLTACLLEEPRKSLTSSRTPPPSERWVDSVRTLARNQTYCLALSGMVLYFAVTYGISTWLPAMLVRIYPYSLERIGVIFGLSYSAASLIGTIGGALIDVLAKRNARWLAYAPAILFLVGGVSTAFSILSHGFVTFIVANFAATMVLNACGTCLFTLIHHVCGSPRRASAIAIAFFFANLIGLGLGPLATGTLSDMLEPLYGTGSLKVALLIMSTLFLPASLIMLGASRTVEAEGLR